jgi:hypothetical protein
MLAVLLRRFVHVTLSGDVSQKMVPPDSLIRHQA